MGNFNSGGEDDVDAAGKYLLIAVPQFAVDPITGNLMTSYLRLGAASSTWTQDPGGWLAAKIHEHGPPGGHLTADGEPVDTTSEERSPEHVFIDDDRNRVEGVAHDLSKAERAEESKILHTRGGWRDHSDGNRISTTYGDKVEVIRGNYKMIVLGRQDDPESSTGWDASGQHIQDWGYTMPGASVRVEESSNYTDADGNNVWHLQNTTEGVVQSSNFAGDFFEYHWGKKHWTTVGSAKPTDKGPNGYPRQNPHILEKTWAEKIEGYTGSVDWPIPVITEETWAITTASLTNVATAITEMTVCPGVITSSTNAGVINDATTAAAINEVTIINGVLNSSFTAANTIETKAVAGTLTETNAVGTSTVVNAIGVATEVSVLAAKADVLVTAAAVDVTIAAIHAELEVAAIHAVLEISAGVDIFLGAKCEIQLGAFVEIEGGTKEEIGMDETNLFLENTWIVSKYCVTAPLVKLGVL